jgi:hypothetical protein
MEGQSLSMRSPKRLPRSEAVRGSFLKLRVVHRYSLSILPSFIIQTGNRPTGYAVVVTNKKVLPVGLEVLRYVLLVCGMVETNEGVLRVKSSIGAVRGRSSQSVTTSSLRRHNESRLPLIDAYRALGASISYCSCFW